MSTRWEGEERSPGEGLRVVVDVGRGGRVCWVNKERWEARDQIGGRRRICRAKGGEMWTSKRQEGEGFGGQEGGRLTSS
jgi:hypothetical protein